jgi:hypothetical protein
MRADGSPVEVPKELDRTAMREVLKLARARHRVLYPPVAPDSEDSSSCD